MSCNSNARVHVVLVPGFGGFDALGQLEYYSGVTRVFDRLPHWHHVLHYFDNFPTAAVATRAGRLQRYLAKRVARGSIAKHDEVCLVGHSTGGLDIRRLLLDLRDLDDAKQKIAVDGEVEVDPATIRHSIRRVVFLSVPHWGTNLANWVEGEWPWCKALIEELRAAVFGSQLPVAQPIENLVTGNLAILTGAGLFAAVQDSLNEADEHLGQQTPARTADAHEAAAELALYLRHMSSDFGAIEDLTVRGPDAGQSGSPAQFDDDQREDERQTLGQMNIEFLSYATLGRRAYQFDSGSPAPRLSLADVGELFKVGTGIGSLAGTDMVYRFCYRACAGGPFEPSDWCRQEGRRLSPKERIEVWDNDGIVNTLSMFWPIGKNILLRADHMDIVGQYKSVPAQPGEGRTCRAYDLLKSCQFDEGKFTRVWRHIFNFALGHGSRTRVLAAAA